jgi:hypothetical protein
LAGERKRHADDAVRELERDFMQEVGLHSTPQRVEMFLRGHRYYVDDKRRIITAAIKDIERHGLISTGVYLRFAFDEHGRLSSNGFKISAKQNRLEVGDGSGSGWCDSRLAG